MRQGFYRTLVVGFAAWATMSIMNIFVPIHFYWQREHSIRLVGVALLVGFALVPVAAIGLWRGQLWGLVVVLAATVLVICVSDSVVAGIHLMCLAVTAVRYSFPEHRPAALHPLIPDS